MLVQAGEPTFWWDDIAATTDDARVAQGRDVLARQAAALRDIEARFGVPKEIVVGIYGIETNFGSAPGRIPVLDAALSLACLRPCPSPDGTCASRERAYAAVRLIRDGRVRPESFVGSGPPPSAARSSCRTASRRWRWTSTATAWPTSSTPNATRSPRPPTTCSAAAAGRPGCRSTSK
ncbi:hypothetical protein HK414_07520 [Ramlibacter terrae]|uniref:Transglycosylase SLT domain-containing protein n=1 Tax=Ramlibacter terrae TaxID=2732511 RepID=A0ABX6P1G2_9BURK|nr:hypothetical protein HK414_07520 [Ramlibacter terrae]